MVYKYDKRSCVPSASATRNRLLPLTIFHGTSMLPSAQHKTMKAGNGLYMSQDNEHAFTVGLADHRADRFEREVGIALLTVVVGQADAGIDDAHL